MYPVNPFMYLTSSALSAAIGGAPVQCTADKLLGRKAASSTFQHAAALPAAMSRLLQTQASASTAR
jgi:hypothetical protein